MVIARRTTESLYLSRPTTCARDSFFSLSARATNHVLSTLPSWSHNVRGYVLVEKGVLVSSIVLFSFLTVTPADDSTESNLPHDDTDADTTVSEPEVDTDTEADTSLMETAETLLALSSKGPKGDKENKPVAKGKLL